MKKYFCTNIPVIRYGRSITGMVDQFGEFNILTMKWVCVLLRSNISHDFQIKGQDRI